MFDGLIKVLTADRAPWWWAGLLGLTGVIVGGVIGNFTAARSDDCRMKADAKRWEDAQEHEREQFYRARTLDEAGELLAHVETLRLRFLRVARSQEFENDGAWIDSAQNKRAFEDRMDGFADDVHPVRVRIERMRMLSREGVFEAIVALDDAIGAAGRVMEKGSREERDGAHREFARFIRGLESAVSEQVHPWAAVFASNTTCAGGV